MYPTKKEILETKPEIPSLVIDYILAWKKTHLKQWKRYGNMEKISALKQLITLTNVVTMYLGINKRKVRVKSDIVYKYNSLTKTIYQNAENPSIISALHELAHHLYGEDELTACRWSVWIFMECFPGLYKKLSWKNHLLIK